VVVSNVIHSHATTASLACCLQQQQQQQQQKRSSVLTADAKQDSAVLAMTHLTCLNLDLQQSSHAATASAALWLVALVCCSRLLCCS
jgi:hypothetical protein